MEGFNLDEIGWVQLFCNWMGSCFAWGLGEFLLWGLFERWDLEKL